eukprot:2420666-Rhodomonas_salina.1
MRRVKLLREAHAAHAQAPGAVLVALQHGLDRMPADLTRKQAQARVVEQLAAEQRADLAAGEHTDTVLSALEVGGFVHVQHRLAAAAAEQPLRVRTLAAGCGDLRATEAQ